MIRAEVIAQFGPAENAAYLNDSLLHLLEIAAWELVNELRVGQPATERAIDLASTMDRVIEAVRKSHKAEVEALSDAYFHFSPEASGQEPIVRPDGETRS